MKRLEFSDKQKALIYERDKGICAFSGKILWILHYGVSSLWDIDWIDHIKPAMKGGDNSIENGICASSFYNSKKKDNSFDNKYLFYKGLPTEHYFTSFGYFHKELTEYIASFKNLHYTDWYLNRAIYFLMLTIDNLYKPTNEKGVNFIRDYKVFSKSCLNRVTEWKKEVSISNISNFYERLNIKIRSEDQKQILKISEANNENDIIEIAKSLLPYYINSNKYFSNIVFLNDRSAINTFEQEVLNEKFISYRDKEILLESINMLYKNL